MLAHRSSDGDLLLEAYHCRWSTALFQGDVAGVLGDTRLGLESYDMTRHRHLGPTFGDHDPGTCAHVARAIALQMSGDQDQARDILSKGIALAEPYLLGLAAEVLLAAARPGDGLAHLDRAIAAVEEPDVGLYLPEVYRLRGECLLAIITPTRTTHDGFSRQHETLPDAEALSFSSAGPKRPF
jgi:hypothetical protein